MVRFTSLVRAKTNVPYHRSWILTSRKAPWLMLEDNSPISPRLGNINCDISLLFPEESIIYFSTSN